MSDQATTKMNENQPPITEELEAVLARLTVDQMRFVIARQEHSSDKDAAESLRISPATVKAWKHKGYPIDEAVRLMAHDGLIMARTMRRRNLAKAMAVKVAGLDNGDDKLRQGVATEIIEWEMGRATQHVENTNDGKITIEVTGGFRNSD